VAHSVIIVQRKNGGYVKGARVVLGFSFLDHPLSAGNTESVSTNTDGEATIKHSNVGRATIYVNGRKEGTIDTPGGKVVFI
jgi:hypothetical protein